MKKRIFSRVLALVMAVSLLSTTAFAMQCLNESDGNGGYKYIDSTSGALKGHEDENGNTSYDYYLNGDLELNKTLVVNGEDVNASLELNGHTLCLNAPGTLTATKQTLSDGWNHFVPVPAEGQDSIKKGSVVLVSNGAEFTVTDSTAEFERDETTGEITGVISYGTGTISGGTGVCGWSPYKGQDINPDNGEGGGVHVYKNGVFNMVGGNIKNNHTAAHGGGLASWYSGEINLTGVCVSENTTAYGGGGLYIAGQSKATIQHSVFENNAAWNAGGLASAGKGSKILMEDSIVKNNRAEYSWYVGGIGVPSEDELTLRNVSVCMNKAGSNDENSNLKIGDVKKSDNYHNWTLIKDEAGELVKDITITKAPTCSTTGEGHYNCTAGCTEDVTLEKNPNNHVGETEVRDAREASYEADGYTGDTYCADCGALIERGETIPRLTRPNDNDDTTIPGADIPLGDLPTGGADAATTTIEDEETPLAGLFTRADAIGYLWEQTGSPEAELSDFADVPEDHYWAVAIGWAQDMGIALPDEEGNFRPDDLVLRTSDEPEGELQEFLNRYAVFAGVELEDGELFIELDGTAEDFIMGEEAQVIFDEFFAKLEAALAAQAA